MMFLSHSDVARDALEFMSSPQRKNGGTLEKIDFSIFFWKNFQKKIEKSIFFEKKIFFGKRDIKNTRSGLPKNMQGFSDVICIPWGKTLNFWFKNMKYKVKSGEIRKGFF